MARSRLGPATLRDAREMLIAAADLATDPNEETVILADAVHANFYLADVSAAVALAQRLAELAPAVTDDRARALGLVATGTARILAGQPGGADDLRAALPLLEATPALYEDPHRLSVVMQVPLYLRDATDGGPTVRDLVEAVRGQAGIGALPAVLWHLARDQAAGSAWAEAEANYTAVVRIAEETGQITEQVMALAGLCWLESHQGQEEPCRRHAAEVLAAPAAAQLHMAEAWVRYALGDLELSLGEPARAVSTLRELVHLLEEHELADADLVPAAELVDALQRLGEVSEAQAVASSYERAARDKGQPWALARAERARGLLADDASAPALLRGGAGGARGHVGPVRDRAHPARVRRAAATRRDASATRGTSYVSPSTTSRTSGRRGGPSGPPRSWRRRARPCTGAAPTRAARSPRRSSRSACSLVEGRTTREAAAALFLSPKTVEYHLRKVYTKLGIGSRSELAELVSPPSAGKRAGSSLGDRSRRLAPSCGSRADQTRARGTARRVLLPACEGLPHACIHRSPAPRRPRLRPRRLVRHPPGPPRPRPDRPAGPPHRPGRRERLRQVHAAAGARRARLPSRAAGLRRGRRAAPTW